MESWWRDASEEPERYCDPGSVAALLEGALSSDEATRDAAAGALSRVVKALELEPVEASRVLIAATLPRLVAGLTSTDLFYSGQVISVLRRVRPELATVERLLALVAETPADRQELLFEALGLSVASAWSVRVEKTLSEALSRDKPSASAAGALYSAAWSQRISQPETLRALCTTALREAWPAWDHAVMALGVLLSGSQAPLAERMLEELVRSGPEAIRAKVANVLGWKATVPGRRLLERLRADESASVRAAVEASLAKT